MEIQPSHAIKSNTQKSIIDCFENEEYLTGYIKKLERILDNYENDIKRFDLEAKITEKKSQITLLPSNSNQATSSPAQQISYLTQVNAYNKELKQLQTQLIEQKLEISIVKEIMLYNMKKLIELKQKRSNRKL